MTQSPCLKCFMIESDKNDCLKSGCIQLEAAQDEIKDMDIFISEIDTFENHTMEAI